MAREGAMRQFVSGMLLLGLLLGAPAAGLTQSDFLATPRAATPVVLSETELLATRVSELEATVAAQTIAQIESDLRVVELEQGLALLLEGLPEQVILIDFLQSQIDDLRVRVDGLEALAGATPVDSGEHPLVGTWAVVEDGAGGIPGLVGFTPGGTVVLISPTGGTGIGAWGATSPLSAIAVWVFPHSATGGERDTTALQVRIAVDAGGEAITMSYLVMSGTPRGRVPEQNSGTITGVRIPSGTATPAANSREPEDSGSHS
jgi:hypothetical protein